MAIVYFYYVDSLGNVSLLGTQHLPNFIAPCPGQIIAHQQAPENWNLSVFCAAASDTPEIATDPTPFNYPSISYSPPPSQMLTLSEGTTSPNSICSSSALDLVDAGPSLRPESDTGPILAQTMLQISLAGIDREQAFLNFEGPTGSLGCHLLQEALKLKLRRNKIMELKSRIKKGL